MAEFRFPDEIYGFLSEAEGRKLAELAAGKKVVEYGTWCGRSTVCMAQTAAEVHTIDHHRAPLHEGPIRWSLPILMVHLSQYKVTEKVVVHVGTAAQVGKVLRPDTFDLAFIDGDHEEAGVIESIYLFEPCVKKGGVLAFHDYGYHGWPAVKKVVDRYVAGRLRYELVDTLMVVRLP
jgi:predicted O-methyltransferase YrrM